MQSNDERIRQVVIVGGGFAGLRAARTLGKQPHIHVRLFDKRNHHLFQPLLYQVAMAGLSPAEIAVPIRSELAKYDNIEVVLGEVLNVDLRQRTIQTTVGPEKYDYLILAGGVTHSYFGHEEWQEWAPGLKTLEDATEIRRRVLLAFEQAETAHDPEEKKRLLTFVVVGGGPTGVELAGAIGELSRFTLNREFRRIDPSLTRIILIEAGPRILNAFPEELAQRAARALEKLGVQIWSRSQVTEISEKGVRLGEEVLLTQTVVWAAGVQATPLAERLSLQKSANGKVPVAADLSLARYPEVFVVGDMAHVEDDRYRSGLPGIAPVAMQQGKHAAENICRELSGENRIPFRYQDKGVLATVGRKFAVAQIGKIQFTGWVAWILWLIVHIYYLIGFKNRLFVFLQWAWQYLAYRRGSRLILNRNWRSSF